MVWWEGEEAPAVFPAMTVVSGVFLVARELYKDGFVWLVVTEGVLTIIKVVLLAVACVLMIYEVPFLSIVMLCGLLSSHLPEEVKERRIFQLTNIKNCLVNGRSSNFAQTNSGHSEHNFTPFSLAHFAISHTGSGAPVTAGQPLNVSFV